MEEKVFLHPGWRHIRFAGLGRGELVVVVVVVGPHLSGESVLEVTSLIVALGSGGRCGSDRVW